MYASLRVQQRKNASTFSSEGKAASCIRSLVEKNLRAIDSTSTSLRICSTSTPISRWRLKANMAISPECVTLNRISLPAYAEPRDGFSLLEYEKLKLPGSTAR